MADNVTVDNGGLTDYVVSTDEAASGQLARVKLAYSADGSDTHVTADASGLLVNLGSNNDVTVTSGTVTVGGTPTVTIGGTASVSLASGTAVFSGSLTAGTALVGYTGISADGTAIADLLSLTSGTALAVGVMDSEGDQVTLAAPIAIAATPSIDAGAYAQNDNLDGDIVSFANAVATTGGVGWLAGVEVQDKDDEGPDLSIFFLKSEITPQAQNAAFTMSDADAEELVAVVKTTSGEWIDYVQGHKCFIPLSPPRAIRCDATTLYAVVRVDDASGYTPASTSDIIITLTIIR